MSNNTQPIKNYNLAMRMIHWASGLMLLAMICSGFYMVSLDRAVSYKYNIYHIHKSIGVLVLMILIIRIIVRLSSKIPQLPNEVSKIEQIISKLAHFILYAGFLAVAASGFLMADASPGKAVPLFGWSLPNLFGKSKDLARTLHSIHVVLPYWVLGVVGLHILGAIKNIICYKTYKFKRIW
jgi:cytochrome b561